MPDLYDSDTSVDSDNEGAAETKEDETGEAEGSEDEMSEAGEAEGSEDEMSEAGEAEGSETGGSEYEEAEGSDLDESPPIDISEVIENEDDFSELYKETNLNLFVKKLKETSLEETVRVMLGCKSKYVEFDVSTDIFGWSKQIKYPTEQFKTFVPAIPVQFVNMLANNATQRVNDMETLYDGLKNSTLAIDAITFLEQRKNDETIESPSPTINNVEFGAHTPMVDLVLQNPGYIVLVGDPNSKIKGAFNFLNTSLVKPSKKQKIIRGKKEAIKTFNLRDLVFILSAAGAKKIVFYNVSNSFTTEDNEVEDLSEQANLEEPDEVTLDTSALEPEEETPEEPVEESTEEPSEGVEEPSEGVENPEELVEEPVENPEEPAEEPAEEDKSVSDLSNVENASSATDIEEASEPAQSPVPPLQGGSVFDDKMAGKYTRRVQGRRLKTSRKLGFVKKRHR